LSRYSNSKKGDRLKELQEKKSLLESQLQSCETRMQEIIDELDKRKDLLRNTDSLRRKIEDNLNYRKTKAEVDELEREIEILEENMLKIGVSDTRNYPRTGRGFFRRYFHMSVIPLLSKSRLKS
jgi:DNA repair protein RAD50